MQRLDFLASSFAALIAPQTGNPQLAALERRAGGRLGVYALDTGSGRQIAYRANERFPMCSTFKLLAVGAVLARVDAHNEDLNRRVGYGEADLLAYAPVTKAHLDIGSMTIGELCAAAIEWSDNTAANLLLHPLLGPAGVTKFARKIGDPVTRLDRNEPSLNTAIPGDPRDTTTPFAMATDMRALVLGTVLTPRSRAHLRTWLLGNQTGAASLRAHLPKSWHTGDKTGSGDHGTTNDVAIIWPPNRAPMIVAAYYTGSKGSSDAQKAVLAEVGRLVYRTFSSDG
jgi:beta-lactamase class A